jgi:hypothetical protein
LSWSFSSRAGSWQDITPQADFRFRFEDYRDHLNNISTTRQLMRARLSFSYKVDDHVTFHTRLATTGKAYSTNDELGSNDELSGLVGTNRAGIVFFDQIYAHLGYGKLQVDLGRMKNIFTRAGRNQLIWDGDMNFEGAHLGYTLGEAYLHLASFWFQENKTTADVVLLASQLGYKRVRKDFKIDLGVSNYNYHNSKGYSACNRSNSVSNPYGVNLVELYLELKFKQLTFFSSAVENISADHDNKAYIVGLKFGPPKKSGEFVFGVNYRQVDLYSLEGRFMDGAFASQKTDNSGAVIWGRYKLTGKSYLSLGYFVSKINKDRKYDSTKEAEDYYKTQLDYGIKF